MDPDRVASVVGDPPRDPPGERAQGVDVLLDFYRRFGGIVYARCRSILRDDAGAQDATQDTFLRVQRHFARQLPGPDCALAWLYRIATNICLTERRNRKTRALAGQALAEGVDASLPAALERRDLAERLILDAAPALRTPAWLFHVDGMEQEEIARLLGCSRRTVATRLARFAAGGRKFLKRSGS
jgi:RNA polymerase sigma-70 factor, ECF subfamily